MGVTQRTIGLGIETPQDVLGNLGLLPWRRSLAQPSPRAIPISCCHLSQLIDRLVSSCWAQDPPPREPLPGDLNAGLASTPAPYCGILQAQIVRDPVNEWTGVPDLGPLKHPPLEVFFSGFSRVWVWVNVILEVTGGDQGRCLGTESCNPWCGLKGRHCQPPPAVVSGDASWELRLLQKQLV